MKKLLLAVLACAMVFSFAAKAMAEVTVGGQIEVRYDLWHDLDLDHVSDDANTQNFFAQRILLNVDAKITEGLESYIELETTNWGTDERPWGYQNAGFLAPISLENPVSPMNYSGERVVVRQAWVNFMLPGLPVGVKIGHQPLALGHGISLDSHREGQDAILLYSKPIPELLLAGVYVKSFEGAGAIIPFLVAQPGNDSISLNHNDVDVYAALANYTWMENNTVGMYYLFGHDGLNAAGVPGAAVDRLHWIGLVTDGSIAGVNYKGEVVYQDINASAVGGGDFGVNHAWAGMLGASYNVMDIATVGAEVAYGTGTDDSRPLNSRTFVTPYGTTSYNYAFLYNDKIGQGPNGTGHGFGYGDGTGGFGLANTGYVKISASASPMERLKAGLDVILLNASATMTPGQKRYIGTEVDANINYALYDNLDLNLQGGVFIPGKWYEYAGSYDSPDTAYGLETKLTCKF
jgi:hypothetical protein